MFVAPLFSTSLTAFIPTKPGDAVVKVFPGGARTHGLVPDSNPGLITAPALPASSIASIVIPPTLLRGRPRLKLSNIIYSPFHTLNKYEFTQSKFHILYFLF